MRETHTKTRVALPSRVFRCESLLRTSFLREKQSRRAALRAVILDIQHATPYRAGSARRESTQANLKISSVRARPCALLRAHHENRTAQCRRKCTRWVAGVEPKASPQQPSG